MIYCEYKRKPNENYEYKNKAALIDIEAIVNVGNELSNIDKNIKFKENTSEMLTLLHNKGYKIIIISIQNNNKNGIYSIREMHNFHINLVKNIEKINCLVDAVYYCADKHLFDKNIINEENVVMKEAMDDYNIDLSKSIWISQ